MFGFCACSIVRFFDPLETNFVKYMYIKYVRVYVCMYVCIVHVCMYVCMYVCTYVCMYVCTYVRMYVWVYGTKLFQYFKTGLTTIYCDNIKGPFGVDTLYFLIRKKKCAVFAKTTPNATFL